MTRTVESTAPPSRLGRRIPVALACAAILAQVAYPLTAQGSPRDRLTVATVLVFCAASMAHAWVWRGPAFAARLAVVTAGGGLLVEAVGVATGFPFGPYHYTGTLGWTAAGVPVVIPLAWTMMAYPALVVAQRITRRAVLGPLLGGWALAAWDLFLDPQMADAGHWVWDHGDAPALLGIPVTNFLAWWVAASAMMALLWRAGPRRADDRVPIALYLWTYASSVLAHAVFFDLPASAVVGGIGMGAVVAAFARAQRSTA